ncbi:MAG: hypothetical protein QOJ09_2590 [Actinomycetota bacterium]|nr:hypothetical protein [Actinomycetota bacterium]
MTDAGRRGPTQRFFDVWSFFYDLPPVQRAVYRAQHDAVCGALGEDVGRILDVGCGTGLLTTRLHHERPSAEIVGFDFSSGMLEQARSRTPELTWVRGDATRLPFAAESFDALTCTESFHWYPDQPAAVREFHRVLRPGGRALITFVNPPLQVTSRLVGAALQLTGQPATFPTRSELRAMAEGAGFRVDDQRPVRVLQPLSGSALTVAVKQ